MWLQIHAFQEIFSADTLCIYLDCLGCDHILLATVGVLIVMLFMCCVCTSVAVTGWAWSYGLCRRRWKEVVSGTNHQSFAESPYDISSNGKVSVSCTCVTCKLILTINVAFDSIYWWSNTRSYYIAMSIRHCIGIHGAQMVRDIIFNSPVLHPHINTDL